MKISARIRGTLTAVIWIVAAGIPFVFLWGTDIPLGVPGEWTWARLSTKPELLVGILPAVLSGAGLWGYVHFLGPSETRHRRFCDLPRWGGLWLIGVIWLFSLISAIPGPPGLGRLPFVLYYNRMSGYFFEARYEVDDLGEFLRDYEMSIAADQDARNYLHRGTHPPGLTVAYWLLLQAVEGSPALESALIATEPSDVRDAVSVIRVNEQNAGRMLRTADEATLWLASLITIGLAALTILPLAGILGRTVSAEVVWSATALWFTVPAVAVFLPKSDAIFPFFAMGAQWLWLQGLDRNNCWWGMATGAVLLLSLGMTLAFLPIGLVFILQFWMARPEERSSSNKPLLSTRPWSAAIGATTAFLILLIVSGLGLELNLLKIWALNLRNHAEFYSHFERSYGAWLLVNPLELGIALGVPLTVIALSGLLANRGWSQMDYAILIVWLGLWISGKNMGEAARLWLFLMPAAVWWAALSVNRFDLSPLGSRRGRSFILALQLLVCLSTVVRVDGFHFDELSPSHTTHERLDTNPIRPNGCFLTMRESGL